MSGLKGHESKVENGVSDSLIRIELISHFHRNPGLEGTPVELANMIGRDRLRVESQVKKLVQLNILDESTSDGELRYRYMPPHYMSVTSRQRAGKRPLRSETSGDDRDSDAVQGS